ncbi:PTS transporter subunit EIIC [Laceyella putida]|uniref:PTS transporter subunit EIIC n=1 Tax=Laceyella putida TaxID=110101 RepID=A0ABW2RGQ7_9BACL
MNQSDISLAESILSVIGGANNIQSIGYCMTRLRVTLRDETKLQLEQLKSLSGVLGVVKQSGEYQIVLGPGVVTRVSAHLSKLTGKAAERVAEDGPVRPVSPVKRFLRKLANIFIPLIPAIIAGGMIMGLTNVLIHSFPSLKEGSTVIPLLQAMSKVIFAYLAVFVGINTAKEFGGTPALGGIAGGLLILPDIENIKMFGEALIPGRGGLIGVLLAAWFIVWLEKSIRPFVPKAIDIIITPTVSVLITGFATYIALQPIGGFLSDAITGGMQALLDQGGLFAGAILSGFFLPLVMLGLHQGLIPIHMELLNATGIDPLQPILAMAGAGQVGAVFAVYVKTKNKTLRNVIKGALPVGILGIGEPLIYGVTLPLGRPFVTACLGAAVGGAFQAVFKVASVGISVSGLPLTLLIKPNQITLYLIGILISYVAGFLITYFFGFKEEMAKNFSPEESPL